jgi:hypothetical protein
MLAARRALRAADACRAASQEASCSGRVLLHAGSRRLTTAAAGGAALPAAAATAASRSHLLPLSVRIALAELRRVSAAGTAGIRGPHAEGRLADAVKARARLFVCTQKDTPRRRSPSLTRLCSSQVALWRASPIALVDLGRCAHAYCYAVHPTPPVRHAAAAAALALPRSELAETLESAFEAVMTVIRALHLSLLFAPLLLSAPVCLLYGYGRDAWMNLLNNTLRHAGPAFIKWGQARAPRRRATQRSPGNCRQPNARPRAKKLTHCAAHHHAWRADAPHARSPHRSGRRRARTFSRRTCAWC